jgi:hypothetical protein
MAKAEQTCAGGGSHGDHGASLSALEVLMHRAGNFNLEWGYLAPAPSFLRTVRLVVIAAAIAGTASAAVVFALMRQPAAEESIAARTLVQSVDQAPPAGVPVAAPTQTRAEQAADVGTSAAGEFGDASAHAPAPAAVALAEAPSMTADAPPARAAREISTSPVREAASSLKPPGKKPRLTSRDEHLVVVASSARTAPARYANRPAPPSTGNAAHDSVVRHDNANVAHHDDSVVGRTIGVTGDIVAATRRAIFSVAVIPSWIGSIGGQSPPQPANAAAARELRSCTRVSTTHRSSASSGSPAYCDHINHMHAWNERYGYGGHGWREAHDDGRDG